jgi:hypothetical protein
MTLSRSMEGLTALGRHMNGRRHRGGHSRGARSLRGERAWGTTRQTPRTAAQGFRAAPDSETQMISPSGTTRTVKASSTVSLVRSTAACHVGDRFDGVQFGAVGSFTNEDEHHDRTVRQSVQQQRIHDDKAPGLSQDADGLHALAVQAAFVRRRPGPRDGVHDRIDRICGWCGHFLTKETRSESTKVSARLESGMDLSELLAERLLIGGACSLLISGSGVRVPGGGVPKCLWGSRNPRLRYQPALWTGVSRSVSIRAASRRWAVSAASAWLAAGLLLAVVLVRTATHYGTDGSCPR